MKQIKNQRRQGYLPQLRLLGAAASFIALVGSTATQAGSLIYDFSTDPSSNPDFKVGGNNDAYYVAAGGNPGGFLAITYPVGGQKTAVVFPDTDPGKVVTGFEFSCDLRVGNPTGDRAADGFSISFARDGDPLLEDPVASSDNFGGGCCAETGTKTGIAVSFDTWAGNTFPNDPNDKTDIEGFIIRVDDVTVKKIAMPTRNGLADDLTSLQTGPRDAAYWAASGDPKDPGSWAGLAWKPFSIVLTTDGKLTVSYKGKVFLDKFQTAYFPTSGRLVMAGRTGGANENTHVDNIKLTTTAATCVTAPTVPGNFKASQIGARRVVLAWDSSTVAGDPAARVGYEIARDGTTINAALTGNSYEVTGLEPGKTYSFTIKSKNVCAQASAAATASVKTVDEVDNVGFLNAQVYRTASDGTPFNGGGQDGMDTVLADSNYPNSPNNVYYVNGLQFGEPSFGNTYGDNLMVRIAGVLKAPKTGKFRFYVRSDDSSRFFINTSGAAIPNAATATAIAQENGCCGGFEAPGTADNGDGTFPTSEPISLTAGTSYGVLFLVKEGGGGDWGQVGWREDGDTGPVSVITGPILTGGKGDAVGAVVNITQQPAAASVAAYLSTTFTVAADTASPYGKAPFYQWYKNGNAILGANGASYTVAVAQPADNGAKFKATIGVIGKAVDSAEAVLTVTADVAAKVASVKGSGSFTTATVEFDQPVEAASAAVAGNYAFSDGLTVSKAEVVSPTSVRLTTSKQGEGLSYTLTVSNVKNLGGKPAAAGTTGVLKAWVFTLGKAKYERWNGINGVDLQALKDDPRYIAGTPDVSLVVDGYEAPNNVADNYGSVVSGFIQPSETGEYVFFLSADDHAELYLSTDDSPANLKLIAIEPEWNGARQWAILDRRDSAAPQNRSDTFADSAWTPKNKITLTAGKKYYTQILHKEGGGGDDAGVAWKKAGAADPANGSAPLTAIGTFAPQVDATSPLVNGLVAYWNFDGHYFDSIKDFDGAPRGTTPVVFEDGKAGFGKAIKLDGKSFVEIIGGNEDELEFKGGSMSVGGWFKVDAFDKSWQALISKGEGSAYRVARRGDSKTIAYAGGVGEGADDVPVVTDGNWHHFMAVTDAAQAAFGTALYLDGVLHGVNTNKPVLATNSLHLMIGENPGALGRQWKGSIDDIAIWNRVLTAGEIATLYNGGTGTPVSALKGVSSAIVANVTRTAGNITVQWSPAGGKLQSTPALGAGAVWTDVGTANPATLPIGAANLYYRVKQ